MNKIMVAKIGWRILQKDDGLCCFIFKQEYLQNDNLLNLLIKNLMCVLALGRVSVLVLPYCGNV